MAEPLEILLVEDYEPDIQFLLVFLQKNRIDNRIHVVRDGAEALDFLFCRGAYQDRSFDHPPLIVLLDTRLPKVDGWEVLRQAKQDPRTKSLMVIMLFGSMSPEDPEKLRRLGAAGGLQKPIRFDELRSVLDESGFYWLIVREDSAGKR